MSARDTRATASSPLGVLSKWAFAVWSRPTASIAGLFVLLIATLAALAPLIAPTNPYDLATVSILDGRLPPGQEMFDGTVALLGTDGAGRDVLSAILWGLRTSLIVAISSTNSPEMEADGRDHTARAHFERAPRCRPAVARVSLALTCHLPAT